MARKERVVKGSDRSCRWRRGVAAVFLALVIMGAQGQARADVGTLYAAPVSGAGVGAALWGAGDSAVPGTPAAGPGCPPVVQQAHGNGYANGMRNATTISQSERQPPGKIITDCVQTLIDQLRSADVFSNGSAFSISGILSQILSGAAQQVCATIKNEISQTAQSGFNSMAFLGDNLPCGVSVSLPGGGSGGSGLDFCQSIGGTLGTVGVPGGTLYRLGGTTTIPSMIGGVTGGGGSVLGPLLGH